MKALGGLLLLLMAAGGTAFGQDEAGWKPDTATLPWLPQLLSSSDDAVCGPFADMLVAQFGALGSADLDDTVVRLPFAAPDPSLPPATAFKAQIPGEEGFVEADFDHDGEMEILIQVISLVSTQYKRFPAIFQSQAAFEETLRLGRTLSQAVGLAHGKLPGTFMDNTDEAPVLFGGQAYLYRRDLRRWDGMVRTASLARIEPDGALSVVCTVQIAPSSKDAIVLTALPEVAALDSLLADISDRDSDCGGGTWHFGSQRRMWRETFVADVSVAPWLLLEGDNWRSQRAAAAYAHTLRGLATWSQQSIWNWRQTQRLADALNAADAALAEHFTGRFGAQGESAASLSRAFVQGLFLRSFAFPGTRDQDSDDATLPDSLRAYLTPDAPTPDFDLYLPNDLAGISPATRRLRAAMLHGQPIAVIESLAQEGVEESDYGEPIASFAIGYPEYLAALTAAGADLDAGNVFGKTALMYAAQLGDVETAAALLQLGAATGMATTPYSDGSCYYTVGTARTALDYAIQSSSQEMIDLLRAHGAKTAAELTVEAQ